MIDRATPDVSQPEIKGHKMATAKERQEFITRFCTEFQGKPAPGGGRGWTFPECQHAARLILRHAATHGRLEVETCNGHPIQGQCPPAGCDMPAYNARVNKLQAAWDARIERQEAQAEKRIAEICAPFGIVPNFGGDPRGYTVKLKLPSGAYNTWGGSGDGYGVPQ